ncbi:hypothetical protein CANARDRAFT_7942 [[Candida] arabinofermentans NRRL YB-2248]|uniref:Uncharacterized protein n=1 Tax=[Candida] arabinofermentans NRRL YB-2248 TaxID=983967 RepID=A0A1E4T0P1_9ASCO|nr:hypothetical protein CANARDRAFT_7942 [[Candida] arabinofermentans NRRL YB-2248]
MDDAETNEQTNNVSSRELLQGFLTDSKQFRDLVPTEKFQSIIESKLKKKLTPSAEYELYNALSDQHTKKITSVVETNIVNLKLLKPYNPNSKSNVNMSEESLQFLIDSIKMLNNSIENESSALEKEAATELKKINQLIDSMSDLKYGSLNFGNSLENIKNDLQNIEKKILE